ncbi:MAG: gliding motility-associated C-terminal domain-containing protein [Chitinophagaceae bacterium]|nr:gliding motility-associated C-terminal domain-containing protein [Chitinophagaceae bacterium]
MKRLLITIIILLSLEVSYAAHIKGGFFTYEYLGPGTNDPNNSRYRITLTVYMICSATTQQISNPINFSIFNAGNNQWVQDVSVSVTNQFFLNKSDDEQCISGDQRKCYYKVVVYDLASVELPPTAGGYIISYQRCCRIAGIQNIANSGTVGNTFSINIPGTAIGLNAVTNSSPAFLINDTAVVCSGSYFQYSFSASDPNPGDSLSYEFCSAIEGGSQTTPAPVTASSPPYSSVPYNFPFSGSAPMGSGVRIDPRTGVISGIAPSASGEYVICVCVNEFRQGVLIGTTRKELHVEVGDCSPIDANLNPEYITCDGFSFTFSNGGDQSLITSYNWYFGDPASGAADSSNLANPTHVFSDTGTFIVRLIVNRGDPCSDTASTRMKVYPGFFPDFTNTGICLTNPVQFHDATTTNYGVVDSWSWNFGDLTTLADSSHLQNPLWAYADTGTKMVSLIATNSKGCRDTISKPVTIIDKPPITLAFKDTLICAPDAVQLQASGTGIFSWTPLTNIVNANTGTPTVNPITTTWYHVQLNEQGCINTDSVQVRVVSFVTLNAMPDTTICLTDSVRLNIVSDGLQYLWSPAATLNDPTLKNPMALPTGTSTQYTVIARIGSCSAQDNVTITAIPYPVANAGGDTIICYNQPAYLSGSHNGVSFSWSPTGSLINANTLTPTAFPPRTTEYILSVLSDQGCPKAGFDTVLVTVLPKIVPYAGNDTMVIVNQPLQFNATGGTSYQWMPSTGLNNPAIGDPVGIYGANIDSIRYKVLVFNEAGCFDSAFVKVIVFKTNPYVFVPSAFTPNGDGLNDLIRPIAVGVKKINYFSIYNRWGQLLFKTSVNGHGWDGKIKGVPQSTNVFVWMVSAVDYLDKPIFLKGTVTLIR